MGEAFKAEAPSAFGIFKFVQSLAAAGSYFYSSYLGFHWQLLILSVFNVAGTLAFVKSERTTRELQQPNDKSVDLT